jgi:nucleotide-binding universal stress UspA family protein
MTGEPDRAAPGGAPRQAAAPPERSSTPSTVPPSAERRPSILVAASFDGPSAVALARAHQVALRLGGRLHIVHVIPRANAAAHQTTRLQIIERASRALDEPVTEADVAVRVGNPIAEIWREAHRLSCDLLVLGGSACGAMPSWRARFLAQHARCPVLLAAEPHDSGVVVATDLRDRHLPVVRWAARFAVRVGVPLEVVHNARRRAPDALAAVADGLSRDVADAVEPETWADADLDAAPPSQPHVRVRTEDAPTQAILAAARAIDADVVVVGARETSGRTMRALARLARRSVLSVPLGRRR